jgi:hypothetical protein
MSHPPDTVGADKEKPMLIDCNECVMQHTDVCKGCIVTALLDGPAGHQVELDEGEKQALGNLAAAGLVPELRLLKKTGSN